MKLFKVFLIVISAIIALSPITVEGSDTKKSKFLDVLNEEMLKDDPDFDRLFDAFFEEYPELSKYKYIVGWDDSKKKREQEVKIDNDNNVDYLLKVFGLKEYKYETKKPAKVRKKPHVYDKEYNSKDYKYIPLPYIYDKEDNLKEYKYTSVKVRKKPYAYNVKQAVIINDYPKKKD